MKKLTFLLLLALVACEEIDHSGEWTDEPAAVSLQEVAQMLSALPIGSEQVGEVRDAVLASVGNGYDEEYTMADLFQAPGSGVGDAATKAAPKSYQTPLRDLIGDYLESLTKAGEASSLTITDLQRSDVQIYWPWSEKDFPADELPVMTYDPADGSSTNIGYRVKLDADGNRSVEEIVVDEDYAMHHPVWVVNRNDDSGYESLELLRKLHPEWGTGGGTLLVGPTKTAVTEGAPQTKAGEPLRTLVLSTFVMRRHYDTWFAGASEFFIKLGAIDDFKAQTEEELLQYSPLVTDFMIVVRRSEVGMYRPFNAVLVSNWTDQLERCALMITEDDGGTQTTWKAEGEVKIKSKTYGFGISIPFNSRDDIVWRGNLSGRYFEQYNRLAGHFGDVDLTFEILER